MRAYSTNVESGNYGHWRVWKIGIGELVRKNEGVAQFAFQLNSLTSREATLPLWGRVLRAPASNAPGVTSWQRSSPFFYAYENPPDGQKNLYIEVYWLVGGIFDMNLYFSLTFFN